MRADLTIRALAPADWPTVDAIYRRGIATGHATFEASTPSRAEFDAGKRSDLRLVATVDDDVIGWAAASAVSTREAYRGVVEHSVYVKPEASGEGVGGALLDALVDAAFASGCWTIQSSIFRENLASLAMHQRHGFRVVGVRERVALMTYGPLAGTWRDTVLVERRAGSPS